jgi:hypothetical protein
MGVELMDERLIPEVPWLDAATNGYLRCLVTLAVSANPDVEAVILFGSAARRELRPMTDEEPSDVDVLFLMTAPPDASGARRITGEQHLAISRAEVAAYPETFDNTIRQVQTIIADPSFEGWDLSFVESVARDGLLLWARGELPAALAQVARRPLSAVADAPGSSAPGEVGDVFRPRLGDHLAQRQE